MPSKASNGNDASLSGDMPLQGNLAARNCVLCSKCCHVMMAAVLLFTFIVKSPLFAYWVDQ